MNFEGLNPGKKAAPGFAVQVSDTTMLNSISVADFIK
jgi:hypothetical protein